MSLAAYCFLRAVGKGSYGEVSLARHRQDRKQVARGWAAGAAQREGNGRGWAGGAAGSGWAVTRTQLWPGFGWWP